MARMKKVTVTRGPEGFVVKWAKGLVTVRSQKQADSLKANVEAGMSPARAIYKAIVLPRRRLTQGPGEFAALGGTARAKTMTAEERSASARLAAAARWGKKVETETAPVAVEEVR